ncbi:LLM class flavin-dependent oxidoreductase [Nocardioides sp. DS6]|uniref:LLM class flavin-dependent oxidoreductase n=1 Tax=Nocardioides eburneus TaxID=3231482 RepID=A0ABV3T1C1_9ACTN
MSDLEFGVFDWLDVAPDRDTAALYEDRLALARRADAGGFARYHVAEHHGTPLGLAASPALFLAAVARETARIRLVPTTFVVPLYDELRLVEEIGMLDQLSHGRLEIGIGKGSSPIEAAMFGRTAESQAETYAAAVPRIMAALETGIYAPAEGDPVPLFVRPQRVPPVWYPTSNPESIARAAAQGQHTIFGFGFLSPTLDVIRTHADGFFAARGEHTGARFGMLRHVVVAETDERAAELAQEAFDAHLASFTHLWRQAGVDRYPDRVDVRELAASYRFLVGSPATVAAQVVHAVAVSGINYLAGAFAFGSLSRADSLRSLELFDTEVIPQVRRELAAASRPAENPSRSAGAGL